ncbi:MAG: hypothetical protein KatS3mg105_0170 [Gemmatales bacterium]|nr:MAG: hypothetical protein KatS3mg105_0170 [Gemmatales bacterium]
MHLKNDRFIVTYDAGKASPADLVAVIEEAGYEAAIVAESRDPDGSNTDGQARRDAVFVEALARAKKENKPIVLDFYASWCVPCMKMSKETFTDAAVAALLEQCVFVKIDTDKHTELAKSFGVEGLPDIRFLTPDGREVKRLQDYQDADSLARELKKLVGGK